MWFFFFYCLSNHPQRYRISHHVFSWEIRGMVLHDLKFNEFMSVPWKRKRLCVSKDCCHFWLRSHGWKDVRENHFYADQFITLPTPVRLQKVVFEKWQWLWLMEYHLFFFSTSYDFSTRRRLLIVDMFMITK